MLVTTSVCALACGAHVSESAFAICESGAACTRAAAALPDARGTSLLSPAKVSFARPRLHLDACYYNAGERPELLPQKFWSVQVLGSGSFEKALEFLSQPPTSIQKLRMGNKVLKKLLLPRVLKSSFRV